jgi:alpha-mannosidase
MEWRWRTGKERLRVRTEISLDAGASHVRCDVRGFNARRDHRLQLVWRTDVRLPRVTADAAFGPVQRERIAVPKGATPFELPPTTMPLHRWLSAHDTTRGVTLISDGLAEGEVGESRLAVSLLRAIGHLSKPDLPERPGHAGWPCDIPAAQSKGAFSARFGLYLHAAWSDQVLMDIERETDALLVPLTGETWRDLEGASRVIAGPSLLGDGLVASATHLSEDGVGIVLRAVNLTSQVTAGRWMLPRGTWRFRHIRLDGIPLEEWTTTEEVIAFEACARAIVTYEVQQA